MQKRGRERLPAWLLVVVWVGAGVLLLAGGSSAWWVARSPLPVTLKLGELKQILKGQGVAFQNIKIVGRSEIRGELLPRDHWTDGQQSGESSPGVAWRAATAEYDPELLQLLDRAVGPAYEIDESDAQMKGWAQQLPILMLLLLSLVTGVVVFRWASGSNSPLTFGRSRHRLYAEKDLRISFSDVAGIEEAVGELREVVDFLKRPEKYQAVGGRIPKGVLLVGPPGTGKTLLARAVAGEAGVAFFSLSGSDFVEMFVGVGAARVRSLFSQAEAQAPCIIFIDELDALGKSRAGNTNGGGHDEREQTLNQLLVEMDGFDTNRGVILMAATNRPEVLDAALLRPGRFDRTVVVDRPDVAGREAILKVHTRNVRVGENVDLRHVARLTPGSVGADLANLVNEAALMAARKGKEVAHMAEFDEAVERLAVGLERKSRLMHESEKQRIAYHEAGHALVSCTLPTADPVHKVSIIPRGVGALGYVLSRPDDDRHLMTQSQLENHIKIALGGTVAEELIFAEISNGATSDLQKASNIARRMVKEFGMSRLGRVYYSETDASAFLSSGPQASLGREYSEQTARAIDSEVRKMLQTATNEVRRMLEERRAALEAVARLLVEKEVIDGTELHECIARHTPVPRHVSPPLLQTNGKHVGTNGEAHTTNGDGH